MTAADIRALRRSLDLSQVEFAQKLGLKRGETISRWERGVTAPQMWERAQLEKLARKASKEVAK